MYSVKLSVNAGAQLQTLRFISPRIFLILDITFVLISFHPYAGLFTGWYEGERVTDGQHGWLPSSYTVELQNEHVRARHLKTRYKLLQAAAKLMK